MIEVRITGIGIVSAIGIGREAWQQGLADGRSGVVASDAPVSDFSLEAILPNIKTYLDRASEFTLAAAYLALADAGLTPADYARWRAGVVAGSEYGCLGTLQRFTATLQQKGPRLANPLLFSHLYVNAPASLASIEFGLGGHHGTFTGPDAGRQALAAARDALRLGRADLLVAIGVDVISEPLAQALLAEGALGDDALGEGACALVLETAEHAARRGVDGLPFPAIPAESTGLRGQLGRTFAAEPFFALTREIL
ncbi:MAG TPA: beta-ketoacyl synthase N-terminal-like domain-containing protein [Armatimonadota bacterium]|jgi:3-oxoacyl-[acyl-carrier-protein] synthase II